MASKTALVSPCTVVIEPCSAIPTKKNKIEQRHSNAITRQIKRETNPDDNSMKKVILKKIGDKLIAIVCDNKNQSDHTEQPTHGNIISPSCSTESCIKSLDSKSQFCVNDVTLSNQNPCTPLPKAILKQDSISPDNISSPMTNNLDITTTLFQGIEEFQTPATTQKYAGTVQTPASKLGNYRTNKTHSTPHPTEVTNLKNHQSNSTPSMNNIDVNPTSIDFPRVEHAPLPMSVSITSMFADPQRRIENRDEESDEEDEEDRYAATLFHVAESLLLLRESSTPWRFCVECKKGVNGCCSIHGNPMDQLNKTKAVLSLPTSLSIQKSSIPDAGLGVFSLSVFEVGCLFGPMDGEKLAQEEHERRGNNPYVWEVYEEDRRSISHFLDCGNEEKSNWMRFINCARFEEEQNLIAEQYDKLLFYKTYKKVLPGQELLVWYGNAYGRELRDQFKCNIKTLPIEGDSDYGTQNMSNSENMMENESPEIHELNFQCEACRAQFTSAYYLQRHNQFVCPLSSEFCCDVCSKRFKNLRNLERHKQRGHLPVKKFKCLLCPAMFTGKGNLTVHVNVHKNIRNYNCEHCDKTFSRRSYLRSHVRAVHEKDKPYICTVCRRSFSRTDALRRHEKIHANKKMELCTICGMRYNTADSLKTHIKNVHKSDANMITERCNLCDQVYEDIASHEALVHGKKGKDLITCHICSLKFCSWKLASHLRRHSTEPRPRVECPICKETFFALNGHMKVHVTNQKRTSDCKQNT